jgi:hypothetical protein
VAAADNIGKKYSCFYRNMYRNVPVSRMHEYKGIQLNGAEREEKEKKQKERNCEYELKNELL